MAQSDDVEDYVGRRAAGRSPGQRSQGAQDLWQSVGRR